METLQTALLEELADRFSGDLKSDPSTRALYSTDASLYQITPQAVVFPKSTEDVELLAEFAAVHQTPLIARGSGTGLAGGCLGHGIVVEFSRYMNRVLGHDADTVTVQPGVTRDAVNRYLKPLGRYVGPDPSNSAISSIGGMVSVDAAGSHAIRVGSMRDHVQRLELVVAGGQSLRLGVETLPESFNDLGPVMAAGHHPANQKSGFGRIVSGATSEGQPLTTFTSATRKRDLIVKLADILKRSDHLIRAHQPAMLRNCCGYHVRGVFQKKQIDFPRLITGSEGTLGLITEVTLPTLPLPASQGMLVVMFGSLSAAVEATKRLLVLEPAACDLLDRRLLSLGREIHHRFHDVVHPAAEAGLFIEFCGYSDSEIRRRVADAEALLKTLPHEHDITARVFDVGAVADLWELPSAVVPMLAGLKGISRPLPFVEDIAVPPGSIADFLTLAQRTFQKHEVTATVYAHAASGQLHLRPILPRPVGENGIRLETIARDLYQHVRAMNGSISGEHGDGLSRTAFIRSQYGPLYRTFQEIKSAFDPTGLMNPDKIITNDGQLTRRYFRPDPAGVNEQADASSLLPLLTWSAMDAVDTAERCNGCGSCRAVEGSSRMCPFFHQDAKEENSPRSKANLLRSALLSDQCVEFLKSDTWDDIVESCYNCRQCQLDCPSQVEIPHIVMELRAQSNAEEGLTKADQLASRFFQYARLGSRFPRLANRLLKLGVFRRVLQRMTGIDSRRRLPRFSKVPFLKSKTVTSDYNQPASDAGLPSVVFFVDYFANVHDVALAESCVRVLRHNGYHVYVPQGQRISGFSMASVGDIEAAKEIATANVDLLSPLVQEGLPVVCVEPSAALAIREDYTMLTDHPLVGQVAEATLDIGSFLLRLHRDGLLKTDFEPVNWTVTYHTPCHVRNMPEGRALRALMDLVPGLNVVDIEKGCSGMAGSFGLGTRHFEQSLAIGQPLVHEMKTSAADAGMTECSGCRMQMEQQAKIPTIHPLKILACAYGLMPSLLNVVRNRPSGSVMS